MEQAAPGLAGKRLTYRDLIAANGRSQAAGKGLTITVAGGNIPNGQTRSHPLGSTLSTRLRAGSATEQPGVLSLTDDDTFAAVIHGDAATALKALPAGVFNVAVTSPPYFWVRDYKFDGQIGHEDSVDEYIESLMAVFDEVRRVLHPEGVFFLNIGDTYYSGNGQPHGSDPKCSSRNFIRKKTRAVDLGGWGIPKKSLLGIPWRVALAMQDRCWTIRSAIVWNRCNAFVEPTARDRPHRQYELVFMFSRSRFYSFDRSSLVEEDVWNIPIQRKRGHSAVFPDELARRCILAGSPVGGHVLDPFVGSGTTIFTARKHGRNAVGIDLGEDYVDAIKASIPACLTEPELSKALNKRSESWDIWAGNRVNFRKPGNRKTELQP